MHRSLVIIDNVMDNAEQFREAALSLEYPPRPDNVLYPGRNSRHQINLEGFQQQIVHVLGERLVAAGGDSFARFRISLEGDEGRGGVHVDACHWTCVYYLTPDEYCQGGTDFYRHKRSGLEHAPHTPDQLARPGALSYSDYVNNQAFPDTCNPEAWEHVMHVPMRFNRMILFRPWYFHNAGRGFGTDLRTGRLIYLMFFFSADQLAAERRGLGHAVPA
ncbi:DUF6445 family protein [Hyphobacterium sp. HN65]|uniref:DUF6445 family protein n=1 Tax=Hyphobacterium lacteum TaxID=3116575 RepID=A0ABU7LRM0_9PROT|nr:DUF6445 family protein [Hyphobacterium sp. HN65]MEE2526563.1 DUF6445 family protein [Hyphobacterium sp. HN65]